MRTSAAQLQRGRMANPSTYDGNPDAAEVAVSTVVIEHFRYEMKLF
jgi:hypothetical protein